MTYIYIRIYILYIHSIYIYGMSIHIHLPFRLLEAELQQCQPIQVPFDGLWCWEVFFDPIKTRYPKYNTTVNLNALVGEIMEWKWEIYFLNHGRSSEWCSWGRCKESQIIKMLILSKFCMRDAQTLLGVCRYVKSLQIPSLCVRNTNLSINSALQRPPLRVLQDSFCLFLGKQ